MKAPMSMSPERTSFERARRVPMSIGHRLAPPRTKPTTALSAGDGGAPVARPPSARLYQPLPGGRK